MNCYYIDLKFLIILQFHILSTFVNLTNSVFVWRVNAFDILYWNSRFIHTVINEQCEFQYALEWVHVNIKKII